MPYCLQSTRDLICVLNQVILSYCNFIACEVYQYGPDDKVHASVADLFCVGKFAIYSADEVSDKD